MGSDCTRSGGYFERQVKGQNLCAVHAVNNLFGMQLYSPDTAYRMVLAATTFTYGSGPSAQSRARKLLGDPAKVGYDEKAVAALSGCQPITHLPSTPPAVGLLILLSNGTKAHWVCARTASDASYEYVDSRKGCRLLSKEQLAQFLQKLRANGSTVLLWAVRRRKNRALANHVAVGLTHGASTPSTTARASAPSRATGARPASKASRGRERTAPGPPWWDIGYPVPQSIEDMWYPTLPEMTAAEEDAAIAEAAADDNPAKTPLAGGSCLRRRRAPHTNSARARNYASRLLTGARARSSRTLNGGCASRVLNGGCGCARARSSRTLNGGCASPTLNGGCGCARASRSITGGTPAVRRTKSAVRRPKGTVQRPKGTVRRPKGTVQGTKSSGRRTSGTSRKSVRPRGRK
jgi:hypothetical protein